MKRRKPSPELIAAIRACAERGLRQSNTAAELTTDAYPLTQGAVAGIASRNSIKFTAKDRGSDKKPRRRDADQYEMPLLRIFVGAKSRVRPKAPLSGIACMWHACGRVVAEPGDIFCYGHGRRQLVG